MPDTCVVLLYQTACWVADIAQRSKGGWCDGIAPEAIQKVAADQLFAYGIRWRWAIFMVEQNATSSQNQLVIVQDAEYTLNISLGTITTSNLIGLQFWTPTVDTLTTCQLD
jgi:hypothetical protein